MAVEFHSLANLFPLVEGAAFDELMADIDANGIIERIVFYEGKILDGRNRCRALEHLGRAGDVVRFGEEFTGPDPLAFVISKNLKRRHLDESQRAMVAARLATLKQGARTDLAEKSARSQPEAAAALNVSRSSVQNATKVIDHGAAELVEAVDRGEVSVSAAALLAMEPIERQRELIASCDEQVVLAAARNIKADKRQRNEERRHEEAASRAVQIIPASADGTEDYVAWIIIEDALMRLSEAIEHFRAQAGGKLRREQVQSSSLFGLLRQVDVEITGALGRRG